MKMYGIYFFDVKEIGKVFLKYFYCFSVDDGLVSF